MKKPAQFWVKINSADFRKGDKSREEITDLMAGGEHMA